MTILVTGVAGFICAHTACALLRRGQRVVGIDNMNDYYDPQVKRDRLDMIRSIGGDFTFHQLDFADNAALQSAMEPYRLDAIVHLGAQPGVRYSIENPHAYAQSNLIGHLNMLELARHRQVEHMVYASSSSVYGMNRKVPFSVSDRVDHPISLYAATKKADELMSETYAHLYGTAQTGLRFFTVYGPWGRPDMAVWDFTDRILRGEPIKVYNNGQMRRDFTHIDDIVAGILATLDSPPKADGSEKPGGSFAPHALYNIGNNRPEELGHLIALIEQACGRKAEKIMLPMQPGDVIQTYADIDDISRDHGFAPTTSLERGIPAFVEWYRNYRQI